jgi:hypothetical protein
MFRFLKDRRAIEMVEAAMTFPIAILVMLAMTNLGLVVFGQQSVQAAARHGARMGSVAQTCAPCWAVREAQAAMVSAAVVQNSQVEILAPGGVAGSTLKIRVTGEVPNFFGSMAVLFPGLPSGPFQLKAESTFRQEGW